MLIIIGCSESHGGDRIEDYPEATGAAVATDFMEAIKHLCSPYRPLLVDEVASMKYCICIRNISNFGFDWEIKQSSQ